MGVRLDAVLRALGGAFVELVLAPSGDDVFVDSVVFAEVGGPHAPPEPRPSNPLRSGSLSVSAQPNWRPG